jgi:arsenite methyltransferase
MESIPLANESIDILISNCVINLATNKGMVLGEAYRVLKEGRKLAVSDIVLKTELPTSIHENMKMWTGCIGGALTEQQYTMKLRQVGFKNVRIEEVRVYTKSDV